ncbi:hypothetical protein [Fodinibius halophilus]|uniref:Uncharacterized protein n=1 Tax=Fodinibius halophilus TaxID=1736908 RepID=A0A6M1TCX8_9BACT|nr:hypothetical protein [Fodinibius halophilus]NGP88022.1 hypothetical protein [Fodinibius halophilus]
MIEFICSNLNSFISSIGLLLDIFGVFFVFLYGVPTQIDGTRLKFVHANDTEQDLSEDHGKVSFLGPILLVVGFSLQIVGYWV